MDEEWLELHDRKINLAAVCEMDWSEEMMKDIVRGKGLSFLGRPGRHFHEGLGAGSPNLSVVWHLICLSPCWSLLSQAAVFLFSVHSPSAGPLLTHADC